MHFVDISFDVPVIPESESSDGMEFTVGSSLVYVPYAAIKHQESIEGTFRFPYVW